MKLVFQVKWIQYDRLRILTGRFLAGQGLASLYKLKEVDVSSAQGETKRSFEKMHLQDSSGQGWHAVTLMNKDKTKGWREVQRFPAMWFSLQGCEKGRGADL